MVNFTVAPGRVVSASAVLTIVRPGTLTVDVHLASALPPAQLVPSVGDETVLLSTLLPRAGLLTVTE